MRLLAYGPSVYLTPFLHDFGFCCLLLVVPVLPLLQARTPVLQWRLSAAQDRASPAAHTLKRAFPPTPR